MRLCFGSSLRNAHLQPWHSGFFAGLAGAGGGGTGSVVEDVEVPGFGAGFGTTHTRFKGTSSGVDDDAGNAWFAFKSLKSLKFGSNVEFGTGKSAAG